MWHKVFNLVTLTVVCNLNKLKLTLDLEYDTIVCI